MNFDPQEYLLIAEHLTEKNDSGQISEEACLRSAISRAYYAALLTARNFFKITEPGIQFKTHDFHQQVQEEFRKFPPGKLNHISEDLKTIRRTRNKADYDEPIKNTKYETTMTLMKAKYIMSTIRHELSKISSK